MPGRRGLARTLLAATAALAAVGCAGVEFPRVAQAHRFPESWPYPTAVNALGAETGMVVTTDALASAVGRDVLAGGANAVDAAVATAFALAVVNPEAGNLGGGGFMVIRLPDGEMAALDFREQAPRDATRDMFLGGVGELTDRSVVGHLAVGVPGTVMGLWEAHQRYGTLPWADLVAPAVDLADGFVVGERLAASLADAAPELARFGGSAATFLPGGRPPAEGDVFSQPDLRATLERIQSGGPDGFYAGETAALIVEEMARGGGIVGSASLRAYRAVWQDPIEATYRGYTLYSMPPSSSGGVTLAEIVHMLDRYDLAALGWHTPASIHLMVEVWRRAFADRNTYLGDSAFVAMPLDRLLSLEYALARLADVRLDVATPSTRVGPGLGPVREGTETTHVSIVDSEGGAVALTTTINSWYGSKVTVTGAGFLLNNEMDDFAARPGTPNQFGLVQGEANAVAPGKRMLSAMTPTIVLDPEGRLALVLGSPGGPTIITTVFQVLSNVIDYGMPLGAAVNAPRVHHQHLPDEIVFEYGGLDSSTVAALEARGHRMAERTPGLPDAYLSGGLSGDVQAIRVLPDGTLRGYSDPRRGGVAAGF